MTLPRLPGMLAGVRGPTLEREPSPFLGGEEPEDEDDAPVATSPEDDDEESEPAGRGRPRCEDSDAAIGEAFDALVVELGRTPTNGEVARRVPWREAIKTQTQVERVRLGLARLGKARNRRRGGVWVR